MHFVSCNQLVFVLVVSTWQSEASVSVWRSVSRNYKDLIVTRLKAFWLGRKHLVLGYIMITDHTSPTQMTAGLLRSLCTHCNEHPWKDQHWAFLPIRGSSSVTKGKCLIPLLNLMEPKKSTFHFLTRTYSSVSFCCKKKKRTLGS